MDSKIPLLKLRAIGNLKSAIEQDAPYKKILRKSVIADKYITEEFKAINEKNHK